MKKARMNISHFRFILFNLKIFGEIVTTNQLCYSYSLSSVQYYVVQKTAYTRSIQNQTT